MSDFDDLLHNSKTDSNTKSSDTDSGKSSDSKKKSSTVDWNIVMKAAFNRKNGYKEQECICPICMTYIQKEKTARKASAMLLSCSHIFCKGCIEAFEEFNAHRCDVMKVCPVCRSSYEKLQVVI